MKVVAYSEPRKLEVREVPEPAPGVGEVVLSVAYCGICGSDLHEYVAPAQQPSPRAMGVWQPVMGHEFSGVVTAVGEGVDGLAEGDAVAVHPGAPCGECYFCRSERSNLCPTPSGSGTGYGEPGAYAEYVRIRATQAVRLPDSSWLKPAALSEPLGVALHALNRGALQPGERVFIAGGGPIGLLALLGARHLGAGTTVLSEPAATRRELASALGAAVVVDPAGGAPAKARAETSGLGCDLAVECVGIPLAMADCIAATRRGGRIVVAGAFDRPFSLDLLQTLLQEHSVIGSFGYANELEEATRLIVTGAIDVAPVISHTVSLDDLPDVFEQLASDRDSGQKVLVRPGG